MASISSPTRITGFSGTLDTDNLIKSLMKTESVPLENILKKKQLALWKREDFQTVNSSLLSFRSTVNNLRFEKNFEKVSSTSSNTSVLGIASNASSSGANSSVEVISLAKSATLISSTKVTAKSSDVINVSGSVTITGDSNSATVTFTKDESTIDSIVKDINSKATTTGVKASFDQSSGVLFLTSSSTGSQSKVQVSGTEFATLFGMSSLSANGADASYKVNGVPITAASNSVTISGTQVVLNGVGSATIGSVTDRTSIIDDIKKFVNEYNSLIDNVTTAYTTKVNRDYQPLTDEEKEAMSDSQVEKWEKKARQGTLYNESILKDALYNMRTALNTPLNVPKGQISMLSEIGITVQSDYRENGKLVIDENKLKEAINTKFDEVKNLFIMDKSSDPAVANKSNLGIGDRLYNSLSKQIDQVKKKIGLGSIDVLDDSAMGKQLRELSEQETKWKTKLKDIEDRYYKKFNAMEAAITKLQSQQTSIASMLG